MPMITPYQVAHLLQNLVTHLLTFYESDCDHQISVQAIKVLHTAITELCKCHSV